MLEVGSRVSVSNLRLAEAQERAGTLDDALETVEHALRTTSEELVHRPETLKLRGELQLKQGHSEPAEADFREAIVLAQKMSARAWELRATMSLARLLAEQGRRDEARVMLADIYSWFTEGFDTRDLKDAKALLEELSA
jgi:predicted ATPase